MVTSKRGYQPKRRNTGLRERKKLLIISTEGKNKTETQYLKRLANQTHRVISAKGNDTDPIQIAEHLKEEMQDCDFNSELGDVAFAFVDHDLKPEKDTAIASAEAILADTEGQLIVSNPCFEIWFLAHFRFTTKGFRSSQDVTSELSKELGGYSKEDPLIYEKLKKRRLTQFKMRKEWKTTVVNQVIPTTSTTLRQAQMSIRQSRLSVGNENRADQQWPALL